MAEQTVNPELVKAAADIAKPLPAGEEWRVEENRVWYGFENSYYTNTEFNPLTSADDFKALLVCLMDGKNGAWEFGKDEDGFYARGPKYFQDPSESLLLLKCVSAQTGIPMYGEGV